MAPPPFLDVFRCCRPCIRRLVLHNRSFTTSSARRKQSNLVSFQPTNSPELDAILNTFRLNVFLPSHLLGAQKKLVYGHKNRAMLSNPDEPATARIGDEVVQLRPLDRTKHEPNTIKSLYQCLELMHESNHWENLVPFLMGLKKAKRKMTNGNMCKIVRALIEADRREELLLLLNKSADTGIGLWIPEVAREAIWGAWRIPGEWNQTTIREGADYAEKIWALMHDPRHEKFVLPPNRPTACPEIIAVLMQMHAAKHIATSDARNTSSTTTATENENSDVVDAKAETDTEADLARTRLEVEKYAKLMLRYWDKMDWTVTMGNADDWRKANYKICMWAPMLHGMQTARRVLGDDNLVSAGLATKGAEVAALLEQAVPLVKPHNDDGETPRRGFAFVELLKERFPIL